MFLLKHNWFFYSPDTPPGTAPAGDGLPTDKDDVIKFLGDEKDERPETIKLDELTQEKETEADTEDTEKGKERADDGKEELEELEEELEEPTEEQLELMAPVRRREILKEYPDLFKKFPYLERAYYREQQFTEILPTIDDAKAAVEARDVLAAFEADVTQGNTEKLLQAVKEKNPDGFNALVDNYLPTLARVDERAYHHILGNIAKHTIIAMVQESKRSGNDTLKAAAQIVNQFVFGSSDFVPPTPLAKPRNGEDNEKNQLIERDRERNRYAFESTVDDLNGRVNNILKSTIEGNIDPRKSMSDYIRKQASRDAMENLEKLFTQDARFRSITDRLWEQAAADGFSKPSVDRIKSAFISKAKTLLPSVIKKARNEALRGLGRTSEDEATSSGGKKGPVTSGRPRSESSGKIKSAKDIPKGMSTLDFLNS